MHYAHADSAITYPLTSHSNWNSNRSTKAGVRVLRTCSCSCCHKRLPSKLKCPSLILFLKLTPTTLVGNKIISFITTILYPLKLCWCNSDSQVKGPSQVKGQLDTQKAAASCLLTDFKEVLKCHFSFSFFVIFLHNLNHISFLHLKTQCPNSHLDTE